MNKKVTTELIAGLDIGTSKVVALVAEVSENGQINIIGVGHHPSTGMKKGVVVNIESTVEAISRAVKDAERMAGCEIRSVLTGIAGSHIQSLNSHGIVAIREREVQAADVERVIDAAKAVAIPANQKILHILPQGFVVDRQSGIKDPVGMSGVRLEAQVHIVTGAVSAAQNIVKCVRCCGLEVDNIILEQLASSQAILIDDEKELGVCLVDIGGGTTDIAVFVNGAICHTAVIPIAGNQVTNDIAIALRTATQNAEALKINYGCSMASMVKDDGLVEVAGVGKRPAKQVSRQTLAEVIEPRYEELLFLIQAELRKSCFADVIASGIVFTGGSSKILGLLELAEEIFDLPVRLGCPHCGSGVSDVVNNPIYSTSVGLLSYANSVPNLSKSRASGVSVRGVLGRMKRWFNNF